VTRVVPKLLLAAVLVTLAVPAAAIASPNKVLLDCEDGQLDQTYSNKDLRNALDRIGSDRDEYTDCRPVINAAIAAGAGKAGGDASGGGGGGGGAGSSGGDPGTLSGEEQTARQSDAQALAAITSDADGGPIEVGGKQVEPGENGVFDVASAENGVPAPLVWLLVALGVVALGGLLFLGRRHVPALARIPNPMKRMSLPRGFPRLRRR
jgi:hypothetical protein